MDGGGEKKISSVEEDGCGLCACICVCFSKQVVLKCCLHLKVFAFLLFALQTPAAHTLGTDDCSLCVAILRWIPISYKPSLRFVSYRQFIINSQFTPKQQRSTVSPHRMSNKSTVFRLIKPSIQKGYHTSVLPASCRNRTLLKFSRSSNFQGFLQLKKQKKQVLSVNINCCYTFKIKVF